MGVGESRYITKLNHDFDWISVDADRNMLECRPEDWGAGVVIHAKEQRILSTGYYKNSVEHKYSYTAVQYKVPAFGWSSTKHHIGVWFINPTIEYLSGGASKQELVCHFDANNNPDPIILDYWRWTHYAGGRDAATSVRVKTGARSSARFSSIAMRAVRSLGVASKEDLDTLAATAGNPTVPPAWKDNATALPGRTPSNRPGRKSLQWPYDWVNGVDYLHKDEARERHGPVLVLKDPQAASSKLPHLTVGLAHPDYPGGRGGRGGGRAGGGGLVEWTHDAKFYQFWNDGSDDGKFTITNVRPGTYTLHAFADGVLGEFTKAGINVTAGKDARPGPNRTGNPCASASRCGKSATLTAPAASSSRATEPTTGSGVGACVTANCSPTTSPSPSARAITARTGSSSRCRTRCPMPGKIPTLHPLLNQRFGWMKTAAPGENMWSVIGRGRATTWTIKFNMDTAPHGQAALRVALAGADGNGGLAVAVNGQDAGRIQTTATNALGAGTNKSVWQERTLQIRRRPDESKRKRNEAHRPCRGT